MTGERSEYPWWARFTDGNRRNALGLAIAYTVIGVADSIIGFTHRKSCSPWSVSDSS